MSAISYTSRNVNDISLQADDIQLDKAPRSVFSMNPILLFISSDDEKSKSNQQQNLFSSLPLLKMMPSFEWEHKKVA